MKLTIESTSVGENMTKELDTGLEWDWKKFAGRA